MKKIKTSKLLFNFLLACAVFSCFTVQAQKLDVNVISATGSNLTVDVHVDIPSEEGGIESIMDYGSELEIGKPKLAAIYKWIKIPSGTNPQVQYSLGKPTVYTNISIEPLQEPVPIIEDYAPTYVKDEVTYSSNVFYPGKYAEMEMSNQVYRLLKVYPFQYNPVTKTLKAYENMQVTVTFPDGGADVTGNVLNSPWMDKIAINANAVQSLKSVKDNLLKSGSDGDETGCEFLIITHDDFYDASVKLATWKNQIGIETKVVKTSEIGIEPTADDIEAYIDETARSWDQVPAYLLLLGDAEFLPTCYKTGHIGHTFTWKYVGETEMHTTVTKIGTDVYYADFDNVINGAPDMAHGRISVETSVQAENAVDKIIRHERNPQSLDFFNKVSCATQYEKSDDIAEQAKLRMPRTAEEVSSFLINKDFDLLRLYSAPTSVEPMYWSNDYLFGSDIEDEEIPAELQKPTFAWDASTSDVKSQINGGVSLFAFIGHGNRRNWGKPQFDGYHVESLENNEARPVVWSISCQNGWFDNETDELELYPSSIYAESSAEEWLRHPTGGATGIVAGTRTTYSKYNDRFVWGLMDAIFPGYINQEGGSYGSSSNEPIYRMGDVVNYAKTYLSSITSGYYEDITLEMYHWFGDPTMKIFPDRCYSNLTVVDDIVEEDDVMNFSATNSITVAGDGNEFLVKAGDVNGGETSFKSGAITFKPGFFAEEGSLVHAHIGSCDEEYVNLKSCVAYDEIFENVEEENEFDAPPSSLTEKITIAPNPTRGIVYVEGATEGGVIKVLNLNGNIIKEVKAETDKVEIDLSDQNSGVLLIHIQTKAKTITEQIIVQ